ncbi:MAG: benzoate-CoA ligase family protein [Betaproteobacteria bacterium]|nr:benzoate-CoA ligase family protein [Betaproteobacteria bacterium]
MNYTAHIDRFAADNLPPRDQWPEMFCELPELRYPSRLNCAVELLDKTVAAGLGDKPVILAPGMVWTYAQLLDRANRIARVLTEDMGLKPGNRVLLRGPNHPMMAACWFGVVKAGGIAVATMPLLRAKELTDIVTKAEISHALCDRRLDAELRLAQERCPTLKSVAWFNDEGAQALETRMARKVEGFGNVDTALEDVALIAFTSGTTGVPKGTMHFHRDVMAICDCFPRSTLRPRPDDVFCGTPPLAFTFGLGGLLLFPMRFGAATVLMEKLTPETLLQTIQDYKATVCFTAPTFYRAMAALAPKFHIAGLRKSVSAGEALPAPIRSLWKQTTGIEIIDGIGSTELLHIFISAREEDSRPGATGKPIPGYKARVVDEAGNPVPPGNIGKLAVKGPTGCRYLADPRQKNYVQNGWNLTGDAYLMDTDGYFVYQARTDDMIISAGYNIAGPEVESALLQHPQVAECAVVGATDEERGQVVKAFVVLREGAAGNERMVKELQDFVKSRIAPYKYPRRVEFIAALPRTETGKVQRFRLREQTSIKGES